jgi:hypothetical protein
VQSHITKLTASAPSTLPPPASHTPRPPTRPGPLRKLKREVVEKEGQAHAERSRGGQFAPIERFKLENNIKEFVRLSIRRLRVA